MLANNIKIAWRHLVKDRLFTALNLLGLSAGLTCTILIYLWIHDEWQTDRFHQYSNRLLRVMINERNGDVLNTSNGTDIMLGQSLLREMPEVEYAATTTPSTWFRQFSVTYGNNTVGAKGNFASRDFFTVFSYKLIQGAKESVLSDKHGIVISEALARRLFNSTELAVGKTLEWKWNAFTRQCIVTGVFENVLAGSTEQFDFLLSLDAWNDIVPAAGQLTTGGGPFNNYLVLKRGTDLDRFNRKLSVYLHNALKIDNLVLFARPYGENYLYGRYENGVQDGGRIEYIELFSIIAIFILLIACINFMNLSTARVTGRIKEVGVKKTLGAGRRTLIMQFLGESMLMSGLSLGIALLLIQLLLPAFNDLTNKQLELTFNMQLILPLLAITIFTGIIAGSYPALYLSRFNPIMLFKGNSNGMGGVLWARKGLVVFQFTVSVIFIISVIVVNRQVRYVQTRQPGYTKDHVIYFEMQGKVASSSAAFITGLKNIPGVVNASSIQQNIILPAFLPYGGVRWEGKNADDLIRFYQMPVNYDLIETLNIHMAAGRSFSRAYGTDSMGILLNEAAVKAMGFTAPVGKEVQVGPARYHVLGVTKNFHFNSLHEEIKPFIFRLSPPETMMVMIRLEREGESATISRIADFYRRFNPGYALDYSFLDRDYQVQYAAENLVASLSEWFTILAILISCLGLFGLSAFTAERRRKEISIRKILGATAANVVFMLSKDFLQLVLIAACIALPLAWWLMQQWLDNFAYRIAVDAGVFLLAIAAIVLITIATISFQAIKAAMTNPVKNLKTE